MLKVSRLMTKKTILLDIVVLWITHSSFYRSLFPFQVRRLDSNIYFSSYQFKLFIVHCSFQTHPRTFSMPNIAPKKLCLSFNQLWGQTRLIIICRLKIGLNHTSCFKSLNWRMKKDLVCLNFLLLMFNNDNFIVGER